MFYYSITHIAKWIPFLIYYYYICQLLIILDVGEGWYVVKGDVTISGKVLVTGRAKLMLCNGARLTVQKGIVLYSNLTVYGDSADPEECGTLYAISGIDDCAIYGTQMDRCAV